MAETKKNMREFLSRIKKKNDDREISLINTPSSFSWEFHDNSYGKTYGKEFLDEQLIYFVQSITIPDMALDSGETAGSEIQHSTVPTMRMAASQTFQMEILETRKPIIEEYFLPWMLEAGQPIFHGERAYTYANITICFKEKNLKYYLFGCRPTSCETINPSQRDTTLVRKVTFNVDFICASSENYAINQEETTPIASIEDEEGFFNSMDGSEINDSTGSFGTTDGFDVNSTTGGFGFTSGQIA